MPGLAVRVYPVEKAVAGSVLGLVDVDGGAYFVSSRGLMLAYVDGSYSWATDTDPPCCAAPEPVLELAHCARCDYCGRVSRAAAYMMTWANDGFEDDLDAIFPHRDVLTQTVLQSHLRDVVLAWLDDFVAKTKAVLSVDG